MFRAKVIKSDEEHATALADLMGLMDADPAVGTVESDRLELLAILIQQYESEKYPIDVPDPVEAIKFRMEQLGLANKDLLPYIGSLPRISEILNQKRPLSLSMIRKLHEGLGIPAHVLIQKPISTITSPDIDYQRFPLKEMHERGYFPSCKGKLNELKDYAEEHIEKFLNSVKIPDTRVAFLRTGSAVRCDKKMDYYALLAWQVRVLQKALDIPLKVKYEEGCVDTDFMADVARLSWSQQGPLLAQEYLQKHGISFVIEPHFPRTYLDGAVFLSDDGHPVIGLTLRYDRLDNFWFTLLHELAHISLHQGDTGICFFDNLDSQEQLSEEEKEADAYARDILIPPEAAEKITKDIGKSSVEKLADSLEINPAIIVGRLHHKTGNFRLHSRLIGHRAVKRLWDKQIDIA